MTNTHKTDTTNYSSVDTVFFFRFTGVGHVFFALAIVKLPFVEQMHSSWSGLLKVKQVFSQNKMCFNSLSGADIDVEFPRFS